MIIINEMPSDRVTERDGRWYLRHARFDDGTNVFVMSNHAPEGTVASELRPETITIMPEYDELVDDLTLSVEDLREVLKW